MSGTQKSPFLTSFMLPLIAASIMWLIAIFSEIGGVDLGFLGVYPRKLAGLPGIFTAFWIHGGWDHLISNTFPLIFLAAGVRHFYKSVSIPVFWMAYLAPAIWVWVAGRSSYHIGASGTVYALAFFLFFSGVFRKDVRSMALALIVSFFYGSMVWGLFPIQPGVSWESHLFGGLAGIILAFYFRKKNPTVKKYSWQDESESEDDISPEPWNYKRLIPPPEGFTYPE